MSEENTEVKTEQAHRDDVITKVRFAEEMQKVIQAETGHKVSKEVAWDTFKSIINTTVTLALEKPVSLSGIGKFEIQKTKPRRQKKGVVDFVPRFKFRASSAISQMLEEKLGQVVPGHERKAKPEVTQEATVDVAVPTPEAPAPEKKADFGLDF